MIDLRPFFQLDFWFQLQPSTLSDGSIKVLFGVFGAMIIAGAIARIMARHKKRQDRFMIKAYRGAAQMLLTMGIVGMLWFFLAFEEVYFLGARFWFLLWAIGLLVWIVMIVRLVKIHIPAAKAQHLKGVEQEKYLPRKRKK